MRASLIDLHPQATTSEAVYCRAIVWREGKGEWGGVVKPMSLCPSNTIMSLEMEGMLD